MTANEEKLLATVPSGLFIGGGWREATGGGRFAVEDPSTGAVLAEVADAYRPTPSPPSTPPSPPNRPGRPPRPASGVRSSAVPTSDWSTAPRTSRS